MEVPHRYRAKSTGYIGRRHSEIYMSPIGLPEKSLARLATIRASQTELRSMMQLSVLTINQLDSDFEATIKRHHSLESDKSGPMIPTPSHDYDPNDQMFACRVCKRSFHHKCSLEAHMVLHSKRDLRLRCRQCKFTCSKKWKLKVHSILKHFSTL